MREARGGASFQPARSSARSARSFARSAGSAPSAHSERSREQSKALAAQDALRKGFMERRKLSAGARLCTPSKEQEEAQALSRRARCTPSTKQKDTPKREACAQLCTLSGKAQARLIQEEEACADQPASAAIATSFDSISNAHPETSNC